MARAYWEYANIHPPDSVDQLNYYWRDCQENHPGKTFIIESGILETNLSWRDLHYIFATTLVTWPKAWTTDIMPSWERDKV